MNEFCSQNRLNFLGFLCFWDFAYVSSFTRFPPFQVELLWDPSFPNQCFIVLVPFHHSAETAFVTALLSFPRFHHQNDLSFSQHSLLISAFSLVSLYLIIPTERQKQKPFPFSQNIVITCFLRNPPTILELRGSRAPEKDQKADIGRNYNQLASVCHVSPIVHIPLFFQFSKVFPGAHTREALP